MATAKDCVIVALDGMSRDRSLALAKTLSGQVWGFKVNDLLVQEGIGIIEKLKSHGNVFADAKLHDIPNTVGNGVQRLESAGADLITIHASGGAAMIAAAVKSANRAKVVAVTILTALTDQDTTTVYGASVSDAVPRLAALALRHGAHGVVCSAHELALINGIDANSSIRVVPGIRPAWYGAKDDQRRVMTPRQAIAAGATYLVIGRPITDDSDPQAALKRCADELSS